MKEAATGKETRSVAIGEPKSGQYDAKKPAAQPENQAKTSKPCKESTWSMPVPKKRAALSCIPQQEAQS